MTTSEWIGLIVAGIPLALLLLSLGMSMAALLHWLVRDLFGRRDE